MPNAENVKMLEEIKADIDGAGAMWVVDYRGLTVKEIQGLRRSIREADAEMKVYKNTIMHLALEETDGPDLDSILSGPSAFIFTGEDPVASAKVIKEFAEDNETLEIKGGMMDGAFVDVQQIMAVAALPSREELIAKLLGSLTNPLVSTVRVLNGPMESFARVVGQIAEQKENEAA